MRNIGVKTNPAYLLPQIKNIPLWISIAILLSSFPASADSSLSHNVGNIEMLISDWGAFTRVEEGSVFPTFRYSGRDYIDPFSGIWVGASTGLVASPYDGSEDGISAGEWLATTPSGDTEYISDSPNASQSIHAQYAADRYNDFPSDITVDQYTYAWDSANFPDDSDYILMKLVLTNHDLRELEDLFIAVQTNWDVDYSDERDDLVDWDAERRAGIAYDSDGTDPVYVALALISGELASHNIVDASTWEYLDSDKADLMSNSEIDDLKTIGSVPGNYLNVISTGAYTIPPGESVSVVYAFVAGQDRQKLLENIDKAGKKAMIPGRLVAEPSAKAVHLEWSSSISPDITAYKVYRSSESGGGYSEIARVSAENTTYNNTDTEIGTMYYYVVAAIGPDGEESSFSNEVNASPGIAPPPPRDLAVSGGTVPVLNWNPPADKEITSYVIYRNFTGSAPWTAIATVDVSARSFVDQNVYDGDTYYYTVATTNTSNWTSEFSNVVSVDIDLPKTLGPAVNLNTIKVAPNPYRLSSGGKLRFINLTARAKIQIYTASGILVRTLYHTGGTGVLEWDLRNDDGGMLASGIYVYYAESYKPEESDKFTASGKFALLK
ncbi:hypothetical protein ACFL6S_15050 [Candidatus Poribacteria bacterium]